MTNPSDIARAMDAVQGLMAEPRPARVTWQDLTRDQRCRIRIAVVRLEKDGRAKVAAALAAAFGISRDRTHLYHEGEQNG